MKEKLLILLTICVTLAFTSTVIAQADNPPFEWTPIEIGGKQYIPFDQFKHFYSLSEKQSEGKKRSVENNRVSIDFSLGKEEAYFNGILLYLSEPIRKLDNEVYISLLDLNSLLDPILRPEQIKNTKAFNTVILDAGHGGKDLGSAKLESTHTLAIIKKTQTILLKKGYRVILTRSDDISVPLEERVKIANQVSNAIFISLHFNSGDKTVHGMETYIISARTPHTAGAASAAMATAVHSRNLMYLNHKQYGHDFEIKDRGIRHAKFRLLKDSKHPAILIEAGFLTNKEEAAKITSQDYQNTLATSIVRGIDVYKTSLNKRKEPNPLRAPERAASFGWPSN